MATELRSDLLQQVSWVQCLPYAWPAPPEADAVRRMGSGSCAGKHNLLAEELRSRGFVVSHLMVVGPLAPPLWPDLVREAKDLLEVHQCLTVETAWAGPLMVDVTWHPAAVRAGLAGTLDWDGTSDMECAVETRACYAVADENFRAQKELLRSRLYGTEERDRRDRILAEMAKRAAAL